MDILPANLRRLRKIAKLTQAELAEKAALPRATVAAMEQDGANPGINSVIAIAKALQVTLDELLNEPPHERHYVVKPEQMQEYRSDHGRYVARMVSPIASKGVQIHSVTMQPGCHTIGRPHPFGAQEFYYTLQGTSVIHIDDDVATVPAGHLLQFPGHRRHIYANPDTTTVAHAISVVVFPL
jgi:XRE family transcriptional regulator, regulator of sulfur utilization